MTSQIPACKNCKHYDKEMDFPVCKFHYFETPDYVSGVVYKINRFCPDTRKNQDLCGHEGKNFEMKEFVEEEETFSVRKYLKEKIVNFALVLGVFKMEANK